MRARLIACLLLPLLGLFTVLGTSYGDGVAQAALQSVFLDRLGDATRFVTAARQGLVANDLEPTGEQLRTYGEVYGIGAAVLDRSGEVLVTNGLRIEDVDQTARQRIGAALAGRSSALPVAGAPWQWTELVVAEPVLEAGDLIGVVVTSSPIGHVADAVLRRWLLVLGLAGLGTALAGFLVWVVAGWVLRPVQRVADGMTEILHGHMEARVPATSGPPELQRVVGVFNSMAEEVETLITRQQEFVSNAAHELRNPLLAMLLRMEHLASGLDDRWADDVATTREEGMRMARILDSLESLAAEGLDSTELHPVRLLPLVGGRLDAWRPLAADRDVSLRLGWAQGVTVCGDEHLVAQVLDTVLDNAVKYSPDGGEVVVAVHAAGDDAIVEVRDQGPGIPPEDIGRATERFWRSDRDQHVPGSGLGLAIASELLVPLSGGLELSNAERGGLVVRLRFPREPVPT